MNHILKRLKNEIVDPAMAEIKSSTVGYVIAVDYTNRTADVSIIEKDGSRRRLSGLAFPQNDRGLYTQSLKAGDTVEIGYRNRNFSSTYIIRLYETYEQDDRLNYGQQITSYTKLY